MGETTHLRHDTSREALEVGTAGVRGLQLLQRELADVHPPRTLHACRQLWSLSPQYGQHQLESSYSCSG